MVSYDGVIQALIHYFVKIDKKELGNSQIELTIRVSRSDAQPYLIHAAAHLSEHHPIKGFRPGKAPFELVKKELGEDAIMKEALEDIINETFHQVLTQEKMDTYGKVDFDLIPSLTPEEILVYKAVVTSMPTVQLGDWKGKKIKQQDVNVSDEDLNQAIKEMAEMVATEKPVEREAKLGDKVMVDFEVFVEGKLIEGGKADNFGLNLGEGRMILGFEEKIIGHKSGEKIEFTLNFPENYHASELGGKPANFKVTLKQVLEKMKPELDDELAKKVGLTSLSELKKTLSENILREKKEREIERVEIAAIKQVTESAKFSEIPMVMINDTVNDLVHDFEHTLAHRGMKLEQYLASIGKTLDQIKKDFEPKAVERIKSSMALGKLAEDEKLTVTTEEIDSEIKAQKQLYANNPQALNDINQPEYRRHVGNSLINRKIISFIRNQIIE